MNRLIARYKQSIVTKKGDRGYTYAYSGDKLSKDDLKLETIGTIDELNSFVGMAKSLIKDEKDKNILEKIQKDLFNLESQISGIGSGKPKSKISLKNVQYLEQIIKKIEKRFPFKDFVLPGNSVASSVLFITCSITRRMERRVVALEHKEKFKAKNILIFLNRLSDLVFLLACKYHNESL